MCCSGTDPLQTGLLPPHPGGGPRGVQGPGLSLPRHLPPLQEVTTSGTNGDYQLTGRFVVITGPRRGGRTQLVKALEILKEQLIDLQDLADKYKYSQDLLETVLFNTFLGTENITRYLTVDISYQVSIKMK